MADIRVGNAPCSWGSLEFDGLEGEAIGYVQMIDELAETGYTGTELGDWGFMPTEPEVLQQELVSRNLTMLGAFVPVAFKNSAAHAPGVEATLQVARLIAAVQDAENPPFVVLADDNGIVPERTQHAGRVTRDMELTDAEWTVFARGVEQVAAAVRDETGLRCVFHHHCAGYIETPREIGRLLAMTDPDLVGLVFDTGHYAFGSGTPTAACVSDGLEQFADRTWYIHFKDCDPAVATRALEEGWDYFESVKNGVFCELGKGCVDFASAKARMELMDYDGFICVEQDVLPGMGAPKESAQRNRDFLKSIGL